VTDKQEVKPQKSRVGGAIIVTPLLDLAAAPIPTDQPCHLWSSTESSWFAGLSKNPTLRQAEDVAELNRIIGELVGRKRALDALARFLSTPNGQIMKMIWDGRIRADRSVLSIRLDESDPQSDK
jgi:hypothetical protein